MADHGHPQLDYALNSDREPKLEEYLTNRMSLKWLNISETDI